MRMFLLPTTAKFRTLKGTTKITKHSKVKQSPISILFESIHLVINKLQAENPLAFSAKNNSKDF